MLSGSPSVLDPSRARMRIGDSKGREPSDATMVLAAQPLWPMIASLSVGDIRNLVVLCVGLVAPKKETYEKSITAGESRRI